MGASGKAGGGGGTAGCGGGPGSLGGRPCAGEFWLGLEKVHRITGDRSSRLAVQLQDWEGNAESLQFPVHLGGEDTAYSLQLTAPVASELGATTITPSGLSLPFSTWDQDHDLRGDKNCAKSLSGEPALSLRVPPCTCQPGPPSLPFCSPVLLPHTPSVPCLLLFTCCDLYSPTSVCFPIFKMGITTVPTP